MYFGLYFVKPQDYRHFSCKKLRPVLVSQDSVAVKLIHIDMKSGRVWPFMETKRDLRTEVVIFLAVICVTLRILFTGHTPRILSLTMDISDDLCRSEFFDLVPMGLDPKFGDGSSHGLMPVTLLDSTDYIIPDGNNNLGSTTGHIKSFLDEMFLADPINGGEGGQNIATLSNSTFEVLGTFQWSGDTTSGGNSANASGDDDSPAADPNGWFLNPGFNGDGEVTTLTNLIDPLFVTYEEDHGGSIVTTKIEQHLGENRVVSSDLISSTFLNEPTSESPTEGSQSPSESELMSWRKSSEVIGNGSGIYCDDSLLRSALQSGNNASALNNNNKVVKLTAVVASPAPPNEMTELRKVLSFPPLTSPTSSTSDPAQSGGQQPYYELKVIDPIFGDDANIPNVEELIMTRIDPPFGGYQQGKEQKKKLEISERKINSTTLSTKWTYTTTTNEQGKAPRRRNKKTNGNSFGLKKTGQGSENGLTNGGPYSPTNKSNSGSSNGSPNSQQSGGPGSSSGNSTNGNGIRKERSLHYCNICCKGFKDKYSESKIKSGKELTTNCGNQILLADHIEIHSGGKEFWSGVGGGYNLKWQCLTQKVCHLSELREIGDPGTLSCYMSYTEWLKTSIAGGINDPSSELMKAFRDSVALLEMHEETVKSIQADVRALILARDKGGEARDGTSGEIIEYNQFIESDLQSALSSNNLDSAYRCEDCGSTNTLPKSLISHSASVESMIQLFTFLLPDLSNLKLLDIGSGLGSILYGAYYFSKVKEIYGVELNSDTCQILGSIIAQHKLSDRVKIVNADLLTQAQLLQEVDVVVFNNVLEYFAPLDVQKQIWLFLRETLKPGSIFVTNPDLETLLVPLGLENIISSWVSPVSPVVDKTLLTGFPDPDEIFCVYRINKAQS
ncbi:unnamed protein product [Allacma fusca]|uniref:Methyltransferase domain-containing protein n=1 Tax=Allacma fusca TaxID=39272 RepID=A0A8J2K7X5_9HEXA|nr:unnamed protein product [Allacma fusca]